MRIILAIIIFQFMAFSSYTQDLYRTSKGYLQITSVVNDSVVIAESNDLIVLLDYESAEIDIILDNSTITTGNDILDSLMCISTPYQIVFKGQLDIEYINTKNHPPQDFNITGYLQYKDLNEYIEGKAHLEHIYNGYYSCILTLSFHLDLEILGISSNTVDLENEIHVEILQTILKRENE